MPNPVFNPPVWTLDAIYEVAQTGFLAVDIRVEDIGNAPASVTLTVPPGGEVTALRDPADWSTPGTGILSGGAWAAAPVALGDWTLTVNVIGAATDPQQVTVSNPSGLSPDGILRLVFTGLASLQTTIEPLGGTLSIDRLLADPNIDAAFVSSPVPPIKEGTTGVTLAALTSVAEVTNPAPVTPLIPTPGLVEAWTPDPGNMLAVANFTPAGASATFDAPAVYTDTVVNFVVTATYDLNANAIADPGEPSNSETLPVTIETVIYGLVLVVDRSGSMSGQKWTNAVNAAHALMDLFAALRPGGTHRAGVLVFQNDACSQGPATPNAQLPFMDPAAGTALAVPDTDLLRTLDNFENIDTWNLGAVQTCTPIGDALVRAWEAVAAAQTNVEAGTVILLTDGYENAGSITIEASPGSATNTFDAVRGVGALSGANLKIGPRVFALGVGGSVQSDRLEILASGGHYAQITEPDEIPQTFAEMLGAALAAQRVGALVPTPFPAAADTLYYAANSDEQALVILVLLSDPTQTVEFAWRPQDSGAFTPVNPADPHVTVQARTNHVLLRVDLAAFPTPIPLGTYWSVRRLGPGDALTTDNVHVMTDLHVQAEMYFGADRHFIEEPVEINCRIMAGGQPVTDAEVLVDVARPGESLGTFLATNSGRYKEVQNRKPQGPDPDTGKAHMISTVLSLLEMDALPVIPAPDFVLHDDGAHGDGPAGNGVWANSFTDTALEGAYSFRFRVRGKLANGSIFTRTILKTIYLAVRPSLSATLIEWAAAGEDAAGNPVSTMTLTPKSAGGQFLGPFRADTIKLHVTEGTLDGPLTDNIDGSYTQRVVHSAGTHPVVSIEIYGSILRATSPGTGPGPSGGMTCWQLFVALLKCIWRAIRKLLGLQT